TERFRVGPTLAALEQHEVALGVLGRAAKQQFADDAFVARGETDRLGHRAMIAAERRRKAPRRSGAHRVSRRLLSTAVRPGRDARRSERGRGTSGTSAGAAPCLVCAAAAHLRRQRIMRTATPRANGFRTIRAGGISMRKLAGFFLAAGVGLFAAPAFPQNQSGIVHDCDRACLTEFVDAWIDGLIANDASAVPLARDAKI